MKELKRMSFVDIKKVQKLIRRMEELTEKEKQLADSRYYIDCKKLNGAISFFMEKKCMQTTCSDCDFCENLAKKAVTQKDISEYSGFFNGIADGMVDGEFF